MTADAESARGVGKIGMSKSRYRMGRCAWFKKDVDRGAKESRFFFFYNRVSRA